MSTTTAPVNRPQIVRDSMTMLRRNLLHSWRYPGMSAWGILQPVLFLVLFGVVFGEAFGAGVGTGGRSAYITYITPAILAMTISIGSMMTAVSVASDMTEGVIARFRTMAIARSSVLTGHVLGSLILNVISLVLVLGFAFVIGYRADGGAAGVLGALGLLIVVAYALTWLGVALGLSSKTVEGASNVILPVMLLPFFGSGFVPVETMPSGIRWFAEYQPFTPIIETVRALLEGTGVDGSQLLLALGWTVLIGVGGYVWSRALYRRDAVRR
ncbi:ABC transporter permease [Mumia zhuanghuii]|uniref:Transport permease protein n=2 Tax=Mumia TaxID=1546255 RepID=A0ABW1QKT1_9ACTN|nr:MULTISPECIES: ABC transporter permease [Mumia]KAA1424890.1 ABC transporter permease [Mumia zhuanghuii]